MQPKTVELEDAKRPCPSCGLNTCQRLRQDYYLSLFFIPLFPVKRGEPYWQCTRCGQACQAQAQAIALAPRPGPPPDATQDRPASGPAACRFCGGGLGPGFRYCPYCGARITG